MSGKIKWPFGDAAPTVETPAFAANIAIEVADTLTIIDLPVLTGATQLDLSTHSELPNGALVVVNVDQDATPRNVAMGNNIEGDDLVGVANDKDSLILIYRKSAGSFRVISKYKTVDAA